MTPTRSFWSGEESPGGGRHLADKHGLGVIPDADAVELHDVAVVVQACAGAAARLGKASTAAPTPSHDDWAVAGRVAFVS